MKPWESFYLEAKRLTEEVVRHGKTAVYVWKVQSPRIGQDECLPDVISTHIDMCL